MESLALIRELRAAAGCCDEHAFLLRRAVNDFLAKELSSSSVEQLTGQVRAVARAIEEHSAHLDTTANEAARPKAVA